MHILPNFGEHTLRRLNTLDIHAWEIALSHPDGDDRRVCGPTSAASARTLLHTILSNAVSQGLNPPTLPSGHATGGGVRKEPHPRPQGGMGHTAGSPTGRRARLAAVSRRDDEFVLLTTIAYIGMRWAEIVGLERQYFRLSTIRVEQQVYEHKDRWAKKPKDASYRTIHLPPFLSDLLSRQLQRHCSGACICTGARGCGGGRDVFLPEEGAHERRSNFGRRRFRPAVDGRYAVALGRPGYPALADVADAPWPGS
ncbi:hypothetical protein [Nonomuraea wenchangensis]|uniref:hypothetical protein n=1 Tax=Nonomuraea wenchangensis TaxID=568860 RepID=UPI0034041B9C